MTPRNKQDKPAEPPAQTIEQAEQWIAKCRQRFDEAARALEDAQRARTLIAIANREGNLVATVAPRRQPDGSIA